MTHFSILIAIAIGFAFVGVGCGDCAPPGQFIVRLDLSDAERDVPMSLSGIVTVGTTQVRFACEVPEANAELGDDPTVSVSCYADGFLVQIDDVEPRSEETITMLVSQSESALLYGSAVLSVDGPGDDCGDTYFAEANLVLREVTAL